MAANVKASEVSPLVGPVKVLEHPFDDYMAFVRRSNGLVERTYQIEKAGGFKGAGTADAKTFTAERLAGGVAMMRDMIYTAWVESAQPEAEQNRTQPDGGKPPS